MKKAATAKVSESKESVVTVMGLPTGTSWTYKGWKPNKHGYIKDGSDYWYKRFQMADKRAKKWKRNHTEAEKCLDHWYDEWKDADLKVKYWKMAFWGVTIEFWTLAFLISVLV